MGRLARRCMANWRPILATALVTATIAVAAGLYYFQYRPAEQFDDAATRQVVQAASDGAVAVISYSDDNLDRDIARAKALSAGDFLAYYQKFSQDFIVPAAQKGHLTADRKNFAGRRLESPPRLGRRPCVHEPEHGKQGKTRAADDHQQRPGNADKSRQILADNQVGSAVTTVAGSRANRHLSKPI